MSATTIARSAPRREVAARSRHHPRPHATAATTPVSASRKHTAAVARELAPLLGPKTTEIAAQRAIERAARIMALLPEAAHRAGRGDWLRLFSARFDIARQAGSGIEYSLAAFRTLFAADNDEDQALLAMLAERTPETMRRWLRAKLRERAIGDEGVVMVREELVRLGEATC